MLFRPPGIFHGNPMKKMLKWVALMITVVICLTLPVKAATINYLYIDAAEGNSSGGHVALQFGRSVYHFQYVEPGLIRLFKEDTQDFEYRYRYLENRTLEVSHIGVSEQTFNLLRDHFELRYQIQQRQFDLLQTLERQAHLMRMLTQSFSLSQHQSPAVEQAGLPIQGAGLFFAQKEISASLNRGSIHTAQRNSSVLARLRRLVEQRYGEGFLNNQIQAIDQTLRHLAPPRWHAADFDMETKDTVPATSYPFYHRYRDLVSRRLALQALVEGRTLKPETFLTPKNEQFKLGNEATAVLCRFREDLTRSLLDLLASKRPDPGYALMVQMARLIVVTRSCGTGTLSFLDLFHGDAEASPLKDLPQPHTFWNQLVEDKRHEWRNALTHLDSGEALTETSYSSLETNTNRYWELKSAVQGNRPIRLFGLLPLPDQTITLSQLPPTTLSPAILKQAIEQTEKNRQVYLASLQRFYRYHLLTRNCVTEIFHTMESGIAQEMRRHKEVESSREVKDFRLAIRQESIRRLGGYVDPGLPDLIPFASSRAVRRQYRIVATQRLDSYRHQRLQAMSAGRSDFLGYLREANTLTSTLYRHHGTDSLFLFFTDDTLLPRPLFGAANTLVGLLQSLAGLVTLPIDGGATLQQGASGVVSSLAELAFFNIRKGSYYYLPPGSPGLISQAP